LINVPFYIIPSKRAGAELYLVRIPPSVQADGQPRNPRRKSGEVRRTLPARALLRAIMQGFVLSDNQD
ncbi:MAG: hypothetical protein KA132_09525, partial [Thauera sp.]|nr:hypothetical protein [Thauera sp.]